jgi:hypothetical protein
MVSGLRVRGNYAKMQVSIQKNVLVIFRKMKSRGSRLYSIKIISSKVSFAGKLRKMYYDCGILLAIEVCDIDAAYPSADSERELMLELAKGRGGPWLAKRA